MHNQYTDILLNIPEVEVQHMMGIDEQTIQIEVRPRDHIQACSICGSAHSVIHKGSNRTRKIRHLNAFCKTVYILAPAIRLYNLFFPHRRFRLSLGTNPSDLCITGYHLDELKF